ncbi:SUMF1/EgtB/PvdO family nonheme iron enzyme [Denitratisoma oestradiolicum]|uniref:SUMF1/EgtB/PvdO family nonheme iron enzyme n=1 Tax=Denitratisoma oestradiolicum TaxID=311182 RepID=UPI001476F700|nr:SUMF1/EgtB/PvdO family nonheme iron enzyme [Denitratisoma oestradiolicum]
MRRTIPNVIPRFRVSIVHTVFHRLASALALLLSLALSPGALAAPEAGSRKVALVVGNSAYQHTVELPNPRNDAAALAATLKGIGFDVDFVKDGGKAAMDDALRRFGIRAEGAQIALLFYAGHGLQIGGVNYLVPVDAHPTSERDLKYQMVKMTDALEEMESARVKLLFLDACRDNPLSRSFVMRTRSVSVGRGLAPVDATTGTLISYATKDGRVAEDGEGEHSPYTEALLAHLGDPVDVAIMLRRVREQVVRVTQSRQEPWDYGSLVGGEFYLASRPAESATSGAAPTPMSVGNTVDPVTVELEFWNSIKASSDPEDFNAYLTQYPKGKFVPLAQNRLRFLGGGGPATAKHQAPATVVPAAVPPSRTTIRAESLLPAGVKNFKDCEGCPEMLVLPAGSFIMGTPATETERVVDEGPTRTVAVAAPFALGRFEVARREYARFVSDSGYPTTPGCYVWRDSQWLLDEKSDWRNPGFEQTDDHPVTCVNREDIQEYLRWLNLKTGKTYRLPSEAEWEYAARASGTGVRFWGDKPADACAWANVADLSLVGMFGRWALHDCNDGYVYTAPVGSFKPNAFGLHDMLGNAWEWVADCYVDSYADAPVGTAPRLASDCARYGRRGGSWNSMAKDVRSGNRSRREPSLRNNSMGFRVAASITAR